MFNREAAFLFLSGVHPPCEGCGQTTSTEELAALDLGWRHEQRAEAALEAKRLARKFGHPVHLLFDNHDEQSGWLLALSESCVQRLVEQAGGRFVHSFDEYRNGLANTVYFTNHSFEETLDYLTRVAPHANLLPLLITDGKFPFWQIFEHVPQGWDGSRARFAEQQRADANPADHSTVSCTFSYRCSKRWSDLVPIEGRDDVRRCAACDTDVYACYSAEEVEKQAQRKQCVAVPGADGDILFESELGLPF